MQQANECFSSTTKAILEALRYVGDVSYAVLPSDVAHELGNLKKSVLRNVQKIIDKDIEWIDARVAGGDRLRGEWKRTCKEGTSGAEPVN